MNVVKQALIVALALSGMSAQAACPQEAVSLGRVIGQTFCTVTKDAFANNVVIYPYMSRQNTCPDGTSFDYRDVLYCKQAMANAVRRDRFCFQIYQGNRALSYGGEFGYTTPRAVYESYNQDCAL